MQMLLTRWCHPSLTVKRVSLTTILLTLWGVLQYQVPPRPCLFSMIWHSRLINHLQMFYRNVLFTTANHFRIKKQSVVNQLLRDTSFGSSLRYSSFVWIVSIQASIILFACWMDAWTRTNRPVTLSEMCMGKVQAIQVKRIVCLHFVRRVVYYSWQHNKSHKYWLKFIVSNSWTNHICFFLLMPGLYWESQSLSKGVMCFVWVWNPLLFRDEVISKHWGGY